MVADAGELACAGLLALAVGAIATAIVVFNARRVRTRARARSLPEETRRAIVAAIDRAGEHSVGRPCLLTSAIGARASRSWIHAPWTRAQHRAARTGRATDTVVLAEVELHSPPLSPAWADRVACLQLDGTGVIGAHTRPTAIPGDAARPVDAIALGTVRLPLGFDRGDGEGALSPYQPIGLLERVPEIRDLLATTGDAPDRLLPYVLEPSVPTHEIHGCYVCLLGGEPELIQQPHDPICSTCKAPMQFLFQLGDVLGLAGDVPVVYAYGCEAHPDSLRVYVDVH